jgi:hypothetical protein
MYQYGDTGKVYRDMPSPIDEHAILIHVGGNANGIKSYPKEKGMISMNSNLRGLQVGSVSIIKSNVEWREYEWRENAYKTLQKTFGDARGDTAHQKQNLKADINQVEPSRLHLATGRTGLSTQVVMALTVAAGVMLLMGVRVRVRVYTESVRKRTHVTQQRGNSNTIYNMKMKQHASVKLIPINRL